MSAPDQISGAPHPRETDRLYGQQHAEAAFLEAFNAERLHHGWLLTGPRGVGKATLAWKIARFLLASPPAGDTGLFGAPEAATSLDIAADHPVSRRMAAGAEPGLKSITRTQNPKTERLREEIVVDDIRALNGFFQLSAAEGGRRVVIIDAADEMNVSAANALLKMLEEPPERATLLLVSHQPSRLLPTIRSRCRTLRLRTLAPLELSQAVRQAVPEVDADVTSLAALADGSAGAAIRQAQLQGLETYGALLKVLAAAANDGRATALKLAEGAAARGSEEKRDLLFELLDLLMVRLARTGASGQPPSVEVVKGEAELLSRLSPNPVAARAWADRAQTCGARVRHGRAVNLDPATLVLDTLIKAREPVTP
ncbi:MAG: DNA polymerase III subunit delta' [Roseobacter sp.]